MRILVTGFPRSGTTFVGRAIASTPGVHYVHEPFNEEWPAVGTSFRVHPFWRPDEDCEKDMGHLGRLDSVFGFRPSVPTFSRGDWSRPRFALKRAVRSMVPPLGPLYKKHLVFKDPLAICAADILAKRYRMRTIVMFRDPLGVVASIRRYGWRINPDHITHQPQLRREVGEDMVDTMEAIAAGDSETREAELIAQTWLISSKLLENRLSPGNDVIYIRHADLIRDPDHVIEKVVDWLALDEGHRARKRFLDRHCRGTSTSALGSIRRPTDLNRMGSSDFGCYSDDLNDREIESVRSITSSAFRAMIDRIETLSEPGL